MLYERKNFPFRHISDEFIVVESINIENRFHVEVALGVRMPLEQVVVQDWDNRSS